MIDLGAWASDGYSIAGSRGQMTPTRRRTHRVGRTDRHSTLRTAMQFRVRRRHIAVARSLARIPPNAYTGTLLLAIMRAKASHPSGR